MNRSRLVLLSALTLVLVIVPILTGCGSTPAPTAIPTVAATVVSATQAPATKAPTIAPTAVPATATARPKEPAVGGKLVWASSSEPTSLDAGVSWAYWEIINLGATLVVKEPKEGKYVGYLAESWKTSDDGLTWDFVLRKGVKFHDGTPLTAADYAWTLARALDPKTKSVAAASQVGPIKSAEAPDERTLRIRLSEPFFPILSNLTSAWLQPLSKAAIEKAGESYGRHPIGVGPYIFREWVTGERIVEERNPDFSWAPAFQHQGPAYIQTFEYRFIPEPSTVVAGLEAGELDLSLGNVSAQDSARFTDKTKYNLYGTAQIGIDPFITLNVSKPPFDDLKVRQAFNMAVDRESMIKVILLGKGAVQYGPISTATTGYWPGVEKIGYKFDLAKAKDLMKQAGYVAGADGILAKDGKPFKLTLKAYSKDSKLAEIVQQQYKALGVDLNIGLSENAILVADVFAGNYELATFGMGWYEADLMYLMFHSSQIGMMNTGQVKDPELDKILQQTRSLTDPDERQAMVNTAQQYIIEHALCVPLYTPIAFSVVNAKIKGLTSSEPLALVYWHDAYIETK